MSLTAPSSNATRKDPGTIAELLRVKFSDRAFDWRNNAKMSSQRVAISKPIFERFEGGMTLGRFNMWGSRLRCSIYGSQCPWAAICNIFKVIILPQSQLARFPIAHS